MSAIHRRFFIAAVISVVIPIMASLVVTFDLIFDFGLGLDFSGSLALAGVLSLTSLGVVAKVLIDADRLRQPIGIEMFTVALIAELIVLLIIGFTIGEHAQHVSLDGVLLLLGQIAVFIVGTWVLAGRIIPPLIELLEQLLRVPQLSFGLILGVLFIAVVGAEEIGLHGSLGALLLGVALSRLPHQVHRDIIPGMKSVADGFFVPLFFSSAGLHLSLSFTVDADMDHRGADRGAAGGELRRRLAGRIGGPLRNALHHRHRPDGQGRRRDRHTVGPSGERRHRARHLLVVRAHHASPTFC